MAPRRRKYETKDLPQGLYEREMRGVKRYLFKRPDGVEKYFPAGTLRQDAITAAVMFNQKYRSDEVIQAIRKDKYNKPLKQWLPEVIKRVKREEKLGENAWDTFEKDCARLETILGHVLTKSITLEHVNDFLQAVADGKSNNVYNRKISFLKKVFSYLIDMSAMTVNFAEQKKTKPKDKKKRQRLKLEDFKAMLAAAKADKKLHWLYIAMQLSLQTTHATLEISSMKYRDVKNGYLRIHRQKVQHKEASRVEIPVTKELRKIINESKKLASPYIVHRISRFPDQLGEGCDHPLQVSSKQISREFSKLRDALGIMQDVESECRPTFHEIRALSIHLFAKAGVDPQSRAAHSDAKSTKIYKENHVEWVQVPAAEIVI